MSRRVLVALPIVLVLALSGCGLVQRGPVASEEREITAATTVVLDTAGTLTITEGAPSLVIRAASSVLPDLTAEVVGGVLTLGLTAGKIPGFPLGDIDYRLSLPRLDGLEINGSGDVTSTAPGEKIVVRINGAGEVDLTSIDASSVALTIEGAGDVSLSGRTSELSIRINGSGDVSARQLQAESATIDISGAADVRVWAARTLDVSLSGAGSVGYLGSPEVTRDISGIGDVSPLR